VEQIAAQGRGAQVQSRLDGLDGRSLAAVAAGVALAAYFAWSMYAGRGGYADGPVPSFPYQTLCLAVAALALAAALLPGRRPLRLAALIAALCLTGVVLVLSFALDPFMELGFSGLVLLTALPLACAAALVRPGAAPAGHRSPRLGVAFAAVGGLIALAGGGLLGGGISPASVLAGIGALCAAGVMASRPRPGAFGTLLCIVPLAGAAYAQSGQLSSSPAEVAVAFLPAAVLLVAGATFALRATGRQGG
jgi:hypothetical protein